MSQCEYEYIHNTSLYITLKVSLVYSSYGGKGLGKKAKLKVAGYKQNYPSVDSVILQPLLHISQDYLNLVDKNVCKVQVQPLSYMHES